MSVRKSAAMRIMYLRDPVGGNTEPSLKCILLSFFSYDNATESREFVGSEGGEFGDLWGATNLFTYNPDGTSLQRVGATHSRSSQILITLLCCRKQNWLSKKNNSRETLVASMRKKSFQSRSTPRMVKGWATLNRKERKRVQR